MADERLRTGVLRSLNIPAGGWHRALNWRRWCAVLGTILIAAWWLAFRNSQRSADGWQSLEWTIGTDNTPPYHFLKGNGVAQGMAAEMINEAARRSGVRLKWVLRPEGPSKAMRTGEVDLWPLLSAEKSVWPDLHFSKPYLRNSFTTLCRNDEFETKEGIRRVRRVALANYPLARKLAREALPQAEQIPRPTREKALEAVCRGEADVAFLEARPAQYLTLHRPEGCRAVEFHSYGLDLRHTALAIASTAKGAPAAERLRAAIESMLADGTMVRLMRRWNLYYSGEAEALFNEEQAIRWGRLASLLAGILGTVVLALLLLVARTREARRAAQEASAAKTQFLATMSHEIRTPLHGLLGMCQLLRESRLEGEQREYVEMLEQSGQTLLELVNDVLDLARVERGKLELAVAPYEPRRLFGAALRAWEPQAQKKGLELRAEGAELLPARALGDETRIRQVLANLLSNAVKFTSEGSVTLAVKMAGEGDRRRAQVEVRDTGIGIAPKDQGRIFEQFSQADPTISRRFGGTGLGLSIARKLVELMGGSMEVSSEPGRGSTFRFTLPMPELPAEGMPRVARPAPPPIQPARDTVLRQSARPARVLLVEDNPVNQKIARKLLERAGCEVTLAGNGLAALEALERGVFSAVFMDCQMPEMDGLTATEELRRRGHRLPVIALTASAMAGEKEQCMAAGMDDYLSKPLDLTELNRVLERWVRAGKV